MKPIEINVQKITVVIPLYNKKHYIHRTIESVLAQHVPVDEIVVIDDGSFDGSAEEVLNISDPRIRLIQQQNSGEGAARNRGVLESQNDLVAFLDADDEWKPDFLLHIQRLYRNFPDCGAYATAYEVIECDGSILHPMLQDIPPAPWVGIIPYFFRMMQYGCPFSPSSVVIPKNVYQDLKGFPEGIKQGADKMMWVRLGVKYPIAFSPSRQVVYHGDATNRASTVYQQEPATANLIDEMLKNQEVPLALLEDIKDYNAYLKIQKARHRVKAGYSKSARELLDSARGNRKYRKQILWWYFWSLIPYSLIKFLQSPHSEQRKMN
jgi:glycosyltransferase involved in cell wall biosynthesis